MEKEAVYKPRRGACSRSFPHSSQKKTTLPTPWSRTSGLQKCETNFCCVSQKIKNKQKRPFVMYTWVFILLLIFLASLCYTYYFKIFNISLNILNELYKRGENKIKINILLAWVQPLYLSFKKLSKIRTNLNIFTGGWSLENKHHILLSLCATLNHKLVHIIGVNILIICITIFQTRYKYTHYKYL